MPTADPIEDAESSTKVKTVSPSFTATLPYMKVSWVINISPSFKNAISLSPPDSTYETNIVKSFISGLTPASR